MEVSIERAFSLSSLILLSFKEHPSWLPPLSLFSFNNDNMHVYQLCPSFQVKIKVKYNPMDENKVSYANEWHWLWLFCHAIYERDNIGKSRHDPRKCITLEITNVKPILKIS
ncbi:uncharacterized protein [Medicago truncatula]|uniref:uncharacterized protein isoform X1 n=1 Tax=Medicago truncatula TaxID=3880 RepID=UPI000D2F3AE9|nr:uncharacterized protein LOC11433130 isoform X1 [Medicago truncatula]